jgi:hypothetical protein
MKYLAASLLFLLFGSCNYSQNPKPHLEKREYPATLRSCLKQLQQYPLPRYLPGNKLARNFNWMDPYFMGESGQPGTNYESAVGKAMRIQEELILHWNYGLVIPNSGAAFYSAGASDTSAPPFVWLANAHPEVPLHIITFWMGMRPSLIGYPYARSLIINQDLNKSFYIHFDFYGNPKTEIKFNFPDSLIRIDGATQKYYLSRLTKCLKRPIDLINENGEEPPGPYILDAIKKDKEMIHMKDSMKINSWEDFMAIRKLSMRVTYASAFMRGIPQLKNTKFSFYTVEGGPVDRFKWSIMKKCMSPRNGIYYATSDFYPRWPSNWKDWKGPWHGWSWIESGRKVEIKDGNYLFSPFVAAGWSDKANEDIRPGQWLGLLKCLSVVGAEFYYVGYFNQASPFNNPAKWTWQAAMPAYAQAITSRFEDVLRDGNVLFTSDGQPKISYPVADPHVLITARKHNKKEKYVICGTYQPFSNDSGEIPEKRIVTATIDKQSFSFEVRRQGSVYIYEKLATGRSVFYQLDRWHENAHPDFWSSDFYFEAETADSTLDPQNMYTTSKGGTGDYSNYITYIRFTAAKSYIYKFTPRIKNTSASFLWLRYKGEGTVSLVLSRGGNKTFQMNIKLPASSDWNWSKVSVPLQDSEATAITLRLSYISGLVDLDKLVVTEKESSKDLVN